MNTDVTIYEHPSQDTVRYQCAFIKKQKEDFIDKYLREIKKKSKNYE